MAVIGEKVLPYAEIFNYILVHINAQSRTFWHMDIPFGIDFHLLLGNIPPQLGLGDALL